MPFVALATTYYTAVRLVEKLWHSWMMTGESAMNDAVQIDSADLTSVLTLRRSIQPKRRSRACPVLVAAIVNTLIRATSVW
jgi:hypothetical protein